VRDTSLTLSPGIEGFVVNVEVFQRNERGRKSKQDKAKESLASTRSKNIQQELTSLSMKE